MRDELKEIWQNQLRESSVMTMEIIHRKAEELQAKNARELFRNISTLLIVAIGSGVGVIRANDAGIRAGFIFALGWALAGHVLLRKGMRFEAGITTGVEFYRRELNRRLYFLNRVLWFSLGPIALSIGMLILMLSGIARDQGKSLRVIAPFCMAIAVWLVLVFVMRSRANRDLRREIDELNSLRA